jgi:hypothetical protein
MPEVLKIMLLPSLHGFAYYQFYFLHGQVFESARILGNFYCCCRSIYIIIIIIIISFFFLFSFFAKKMPEW